MESARLYCANLGPQGDTGSFEALPWDLPCGTWEVASIDAADDAEWAMPLGDERFGLCRQFILLDCKGRLVVDRPVPGQRFVVSGDCCQGREKAPVLLLTSMSFRWGPSRSGYGFGTINRVSRQGTATGELWTCRPDAGAGEEWKGFGFDLWLAPDGHAWKIRNPPQSHPDSGRPMGIVDHDHRSTLWKRDGELLRVASEMFVEIGRPSGGELELDSFRTSIPKDSMSDEQRMSLSRREFFERYAAQNPGVVWEPGKEPGPFPRMRCRLTEKAHLLTEEEYYRARGEAWTPVVAGGR